MSVDTKNQHFLPQFVMRRFAVPDTRAKAVAVFDLDSGHYVARASIRGQASKSFLYGSDGVAESAFCDLETEASAVIAEVIRTEQYPAPMTKDNAVVTKFLALQQGRTPAAASQLEAMFTRLTRGILKHPGVPEDVRKHADGVSVKHHRPALASAINQLEIAVVLDDLAGVIVVNETRTEFVCPDTGVVFHNQWAKPVQALGVLGYACSGLQVFLPLGPRHVLCRYDSEVYVPRRSAGTIRLREPKDVNQLNRLLCSCAEQLAYFSGHDETRVVLERMRPTLNRRPVSAAGEIARFGATTGSGQLLHYHATQTNEPFPMRWLPVKPSMARFPLRRRGQTYRVQAEAAMKRFAPRTRPTDTPPKGQLFERLPD